MYQCPNCAAVVTDSGKRLLGARCYLCGARLYRVQPTDPQPRDLSPVLSPFEARRRLDARAESEA